MPTSRHRVRVVVTSGFLILLLLPAGADAAEQVVRVADDAALRSALAKATPGTRILVAPGTYRGNLYVTSLAGTEAEPIRLEGEEPDRPPVIRGSAEGIHLTDARHVVLRALVFEGQSGNAINVDDGGSYETPSQHLLLENLIFRDVGPEPGSVAIKLAGVDDVVIRGCVIENFAGLGVDMVGCHRGVIEACEFRGLRDHDSVFAVQLKGGTTDVVVRRCRFTGRMHRGINLGGSTGMPYFRPKDVKRYEAKDLIVEDCTFDAGTRAAVAYVGVDGAIVRRNTIYRPAQFLVRILQETTAQGFVPCRNGAFEHNLVVFRRADLSDPINVGPGTDPKSFTFTGNWWYCEDRPEQSRPPLPVEEEGGTYGVDPKLKDPAGGDFAPALPAAAMVGATSRVP